MASETMSTQNTSDPVLPIETDRQHVQASSSPAAGPKTGPDTSLQEGNRIEVPAEQIKKPSEVNRDDPNINVVELSPHSPTFKEQVYGKVALITQFPEFVDMPGMELIRGTMLGQPNVKEQGAEVLRGERGVPQRRGSQSSK